MSTESHYPFAAVGHASRLAGSHIVEAGHHLLATLLPSSNATALLARLGVDTTRLRREAIVYSNPGNCRQAVGGLLRVWCRRTFVPISLINEWTWAIARDMVPQSRNRRVRHFPKHIYGCQRPCQRMREPPTLNQHMLLTLLENNDFLTALPAFSAAKILKQLRYHDAVYGA